MTRRVVAVCTAALAVVMATFSWPVRSDASGPPVTAPPASIPLPAAASYVLVDAGTGNTLAGHNERRRLPP
ncbi:MAG TPA: hypothetical protein VED59_09835, partial [Acidimicrobiales bacterium]|nr:hypothetical protein [Acidimicrobiales bacterium]